MKMLHILKPLYIPLSFLIFVSMELTHAASFTRENDTLTAKQRNPNPKIVGGTAIAIEQARFQVSVRLKTYEEEYGFGEGHICGGSVISQRVVITGAHCVVNYKFFPILVRDASELTLVMGTASLYKTDVNTLQYDVQKILSHNGFNPYSRYVNNIALLFIKGYIPWNAPTVKAIALAKQAIPTNTLCAVTGWGKTENDQISPVLMAGYVPIVSNEECSTNYENIPVGMICAGFMSTGDIDACQGDSGSPLQCNNVLTGIVSWGTGCGVIGYPAVYTDVFEYNSWIVSNNATLDYTYYGGNDTDDGDNASSISGQSRLFILFVVLITFIFPKAWGVIM